MQDFFPTMMMKPNDGCDDYYCRLRQKEHKEALALNPVKETVLEEAVVVVHEDNEWGNSVVCIINDFSICFNFAVTSFRNIVGG